ncbi:MAG: TM2 domain-containing protein [Candidatus Saccharimonadales bacterium]
MQSEETDTLPPAAPLENSDPVKIEPVEPLKPIKKMPRQRHFLAVFFISFMWGTFGVDRFYMGYWVTGFLKLMTFGGFGLWAMIDLIIIMTGTMKDKQGRDMLQVAEYKRFAARTILIFAISLGLFVLLNGIAIIVTVTQLISGLQDGSLNGIDINQLQSGGGLSPDQIKSLGL